MLPLHTSPPPSSSSPSSKPHGTHRANGFRDYVRRFLHYTHMDLEHTGWLMLYLCINPHKVYRMTAWHKQTKNQWARDDPAFVAIQLAFIAVSSLAWGSAFGSYGIGNVATMLWILCWGIVIDFLAAGAVIASVGYWVSNRFLLAHSAHNVDQKVEWLYAFDVHCNSFFPVFLVLHVVQYFLIPLLIQQSFFVTVLSNTLYAASYTYYLYITFLGYNVLPFLHRTVVFLYPVALVAILWLVTTLLNFNLSIATLNLYFTHSAGQ